jgi:hypothetical protein
VAQNLKKKSIQSKRQICVGDFSNFVALSEYIGFKGGGEKIRPLNFTEGI